MSLPKSRKYVSPNQKSIDLQKGIKKQNFKCTKCFKEKPKSEGYRKNWYWCKDCHRKYTSKRPKKMSYNELW